VATQRKLSTKWLDWPSSSARLGRSRPGAAGLAHLVCMKTTTHPETGLGPVLTLSQLAAQLGVSVQTLYDLRSQGRGPRGFRVGRELRFRVSEVDAWLAQMEADDAERHPRQAG
jgi:excisionase family DNA binding protein